MISNVSNNFSMIESILFCVLTRINVFFHYTLQLYPKKPPKNSLINTLWLHYNNNLSTSMFTYNLYKSSGIITWFYFTYIYSYVNYLKSATNDYKSIYVLKSITYNNPFVV